MLIEICVPSKARATIFARKTLAFLQHTSLPWRVFVEPQDAKAYASLIPAARLTILPENDGGLGVALNAMRETSKAKYVWKMDDDLHHWYTGQRVSSRDSEGRMINECANLLSAVDAEFKQTLGGFSFGPIFRHDDWRDLTHLNKMFETTYIVRRDSWLVPKDLRGYHEEFVASGNLLTKGMIVPRVGKYCWAADLSTYAGGLQSFDREIEQGKYFDLLESKYPNLAKLTRRREYTQKTGKVFTVTDKTYYNREYSKRLKSDSLVNLLKELRCLSESV